MGTPIYYVLCSSMSKYGSCSSLGCMGFSGPESMTCTRYDEKKLAQEPNTTHYQPVILYKYVVIYDNELRLVQNCLQLLFCKKNYLRA